MKPRTVEIYATCLADQMFPEVAKATVAVLRRLGCDVAVPAGQTCCGQPAFNAGFRHQARPAAGRVREWLQTSTADAIVLPSGSCALMIREHYADLFPADDPENFRRRVFELSQFLTDELGLDAVPGAGMPQPSRLAFHDSCHALRGLKIADGPRKLLRAAGNVDLVDLDTTRECCGFGGTFSEKMPEISADMATKKADLARDAGAQFIVGADLGCLMHLGGRLRRLSRHVGVLHLAQVLAGPEFCRPL